MAMAESDTVERYMWLSATCDSLAGRVADKHKPFSTDRQQKLIHKLLNKQDMKETIIAQL